MRGNMTLIIDFESYKKSKEKQPNGVVNLWNQFPVEIPENYKPGDILVRVDNALTGIEFSFPTKQEMKVYNEIEAHQPYFLWADMKKVAMILDNSDNLIG